MSKDRRRSLGQQVGPLWVVRRGDTGRPVVLLHGNSGSHREFDALVRRLPGRTLVAMDSRGHGWSPRGSGDLTIASMADDVAQVLRLLDLHDVDVLGYSDGGNIALELAMRHPGVVHRMLVSGANLFPEGLARKWVLLTRVVHRLLALGARVLSPLRGPAERWALMTEHPQISPSDLAAITVPVLVLVGEHDATTPDHTALIVESLPSARLVVLPGAGHDIPGTRPDDLARLVEEHFTD
ncbi:MAG: alpha/beta hydrolase [Micrococcales bacterium]|nr:alpha/beta hydrolase [Micrococcales bacterium]